MATVTVWTNVSPGLGDKVLSAGTATQPLLEVSYPRITGTVIKGRDGKTMGRVENPGRTIVRRGL